MQNPQQAKYSRTYILALHQMKYYKKICFLPSFSFNYFSLWGGKKTLQTPNITQVFDSIKNAEAYRVLIIIIGAQFILRRDLFNMLILWWGA